MSRAALIRTWTTSSSASARGKQPNLPAQLGYQAMAAIGMGVQAYRQGEVLFFDRTRSKVTNKPVTT